MKRMCLAAAGLMLLSTGAAAALEVEEKVTTEATPDAVWAAIGDFCGIADWHPAVEKCEQGEVEGQLRRTLTLTGAPAVLVEDLVSRDDEAMSYSYRIIEGPLPVQNYESTITVSETGDGSEITWTGEFDAAEGTTDAEAQEVITGVYQAGLEGIVSAASQ